MRWLTRWRSDWSRRRVAAAPSAPCLKPRGSLPQTTRLTLPTAAGQGFARARSLQGRLRRRVHQPRHGGHAVRRQGRQAELQRGRKGAEAYCLARALPRAVRHLPGQGPRGARRQGRARRSAREAHCRLMRTRGQSQRSRKARVTEHGRVDCARQAAGPSARAAPRQTATAALRCSRAPCSAVPSSACEAACASGHERIARCAAAGQVR